MISLIYVVLTLRFTWNIFLQNYIIYDTFTIVNKHNKIEDYVQEKWYNKISQDNFR